MNAAGTRLELENESSLQLDAAGRFRHLLTLKGLDERRLTDILDDAENERAPAGSLPARSQALPGPTVANLLFEPCTRSPASFDLADSPDSFITQQETSSVALRMAVLDRVIATRTGC